MPDTPAARLTAAQARHAASTPGTWTRFHGWHDRIYGAGGAPIGTLNTPQDASFIVYAHDEDVPALVLLGRAMLGLLEELSEAQVTWYNEKYDHYSCGFCGADQMNIEGEWEHTPDCLISRVRALLAGTGLEVAK